tara:strand:+ start:186 stop:392 length:207 start_codon:yes stop_codon:yes gene_type:complete
MAQDINVPVILVIKMRIIYGETWKKLLKKDYNSYLLKFWGNQCAMCPENKCVQCVEEKRMLRKALERK